MVLTVEDGFCYDVHTAKPTRFECFGTFINMFKGVLCFIMCGYILRKMFKNHRRALAGYTKNTISIDVHMILMFMVGLWSVAWGATKMFDVSNTETVDDFSRKDIRLLAVSLSLCYALSSLCEVLILLLLCSRSIGKNDFTRSLVIGISWAVISFVSLVVLVIVHPVEESSYMISRYLLVGVLVRNTITFLLGAFSICFFYATNSDRMSILTFSSYLCPIFLVMSVGQGMLLSNSYVAVNFGLCIMDMSEIIHFVVFPAICYFSLKRDCQYWSIGVDEDEETSMLGYTNELTWSEMPNYQDLVIPKTELFYRSTLVETVDVSVEIHLWRRKLACVKRFKFDLLTRDNIKFFKDEANIFKKISHENIVRFYGILIDPPSLGIVMHFCINSDVFKNIEKLRLEIRKDACVTGDATSVHVVNPLSKDSEAIREKRDLLMRNSFAQRKNCLTILEDHVVHSVVSKEKELVKSTDLPNSELDDESDERGYDRRLPSLRFTGRTRVSSVLRHLETKDSFEPMLVALQVSRGMAYLHSQGITHRDLKSLNILLDEKFNAQIADFGDSSFGESSAGESKIIEMGTPGWAAPELLLGEGVSKASDVFSFGIILWELLTFRAPSVLLNLEMLQLPEVRNLPCTFEHPLLNSKNRPNIPFDISDKSSFSSNPSISNLSSFFDRKPSQNPSMSGDNAIVTQNHDLTLIEIGDPHSAKVLMCDMNLRPPLPCDIPSTLKNILVSSWSVNQADRPSFSDIYNDLEKMLVNQEFEKFDIPCNVESVINVCAATDRLSDKTARCSMSIDFMTEQI